MILIDTNIWSLALRRRHHATSPEKQALIQIIRQDRARIIGAIRQELLSGIATLEQFEKVNQNLSAFKDTQAYSADHVLAAKFANTCRKSGIQGNPIDFLICAIAHNNDFQIFTLDKDFIHYQQYIPIHLYKVP